MAERSVCCLKWVFAPLPWLSSFSIINRAGNVQKVFSYTFKVYYHVKIFYGTMQKWGWRFDCEGDMNKKDA